MCNPLGPKCSIDVSCAVAPQDEKMEWRNKWKESLKKGHMKWRSEWWSERWTVCTEEKVGEQQQDKNEWEQRKPWTSAKASETTRKCVGLHPSLFDVHSLYSHGPFHSLRRSLLNIHLVSRALFHAFWTQFKPFLAIFCSLPILLSIIQCYFAE